MSRDVKTDKNADQNDKDTGRFIERNNSREFGNIPHGNCRGVDIIKRINDGQNSAEDFPENGRKYSENIFIGIDFGKPRIDKIKRYCGDERNYISKPQISAGDRIARNDRNSADNKEGRDTDRLFFRYFCFVWS